MNAFYSGCYDQSDIAADAAIEVSKSDAFRLLNTLEYPHGFLGIYLNDNLVLQFSHHTESLYVEILDQRLLEVESCIVNVPIGERIIECAFAGTDIKSATSAAFLSWKKESLKP